MPQPHRPQPRPPADATTGLTGIAPPGTPPARTLDGILVADFSRAPAGPLAAATLAGLGIEAIKVERPGTGDGARSWGPPFVADHPAGAAPEPHGDGAPAARDGRVPHRPVRDAGLPRRAAARGGGGQ
ncbi:CoA transferase [Streptomyces sp. NPDC058773]|uniref:CoA transferase n=1 Tax=Streptomyces sp. NPDC058773 TaxID=3346632 RepID=UPI0036C2BF1C